MSEEKLRRPCAKLSSYSQLFPSCVHSALSEAEKDTVFIQLEASLE